MHMQKDHQFSVSEPGRLSTELRMLALIRMGISKRSKIAKILNLSVTTVYVYHYNIQKNSLLSSKDFDRVIASL